MQEEEDFGIPKILNIFPFFCKGEFVRIDPLKLPHPAKWHPPKRLGHSAEDDILLRPSQFWGSVLYSSSAQPQKNIIIWRKRYASACREVLLKIKKNACREALSSLKIWALKTYSLLGGMQIRNLEGTLRPFWFNQMN